MKTAMNKQRFGALIVSAAFLFMMAAPLFFPAALHAQSLELPCDGGDADPCDFNDLIELVKRIINYLVVLSVVVFALIVAYAGFLMVSNRGNPRGISEAKRMITKSVTGFVIILASWLIVQAVTAALLKPEFAPTGMS